jgi:hypothetical protein
MGDFLAAAMGFPTVLFSFLLVVVVGFWVLVLLGGADAEILDGDGGFDSAMLRGLGGVPLTVALSLMIALAWFVSLAGTALLDRAGAGGPVAVLAVLVVALLMAWLGTRVLVAPLRRVFADGGSASRADFVGLLCVVRTGRVDLEFGQAEVTAADGSSAVVQVRQHGDDALTNGSTALIYEYDADGEFFWVTAFNPALGAGGKQDK